MGSLVQKSDKTTSREKKFLHKKFICRKIILMGVLEELQESHFLHQKTLQLGNNVTTCNNLYPAAT
jgi:hypothetical protein